MYIPQSQRVPWYMPHDDGRKSRCSDVGMMTKRSSHMPTLTNIAVMKSPTVDGAHAPEPHHLRREAVADDQHRVHLPVRAGARG